MRRASFVVVLGIIAVALLGLRPAWSQAVVDQDTLELAADGLRARSVYVDASAERALAPDVAAELEDAIAAGDTPVYVAVLSAEVGGDPGLVPAALARATGLDGTYAVVVGNSFRAASNVLASGQAEALATSAFEDQQAGGTRRS